MLKQLRYLLWALAALVLVSCAKEDGPVGPDPGPQKDIVDQVSQYDATPFDGQKRAGVFYEVFVRSFADSNNDGMGDLKGVTAKLPYLDDLGVSGIWLMPVFKCNSYHGYDVIDYRVVNPDYGTNADLEELIREAHKRKIRVILDFVPNHSSSLAEWFTTACSSTTNSYRGFYHFKEGFEARPWYQVPEPGTTNYIYHGDFDRSMPDLNYGPVASVESNATFQAMVGAAKFWIDRGVDGFRLDAVKHIYDNETSDENPTFLKKFYSALNSYFSGKSTLGDTNIYMVGECWTAVSTMSAYYKGLPSLFYFDGWSKYLSYAITNSHAKWLPKDLLADQARFAAVRSDYIMATKLSNHDEDRARTTLSSGVGLTTGLERSKIAAAVLLTVSGEPYIYYGEELGMVGSKMTGDHNVREPMLWAPKAEDTFRTTWTPSANNNDTSVGNIETHAQSTQSLYNVYRKFMRLRNTYPALATGTMSLPAGFSDADATNKQVMAFCRTQGSERLLVLHNVSATQSTYTVNEAIVRPIADMNAVTIRTESANKHVVTMPAYSSIILQF